MVKVGLEKPMNLRSDEDGEEEEEEGDINIYYYLNRYFSIPWLHIDPRLARRDE